MPLTKSFTDDPISPGGTATLDFTITNFDRLFSATGIAFTDDLTTLVPALAGLTFSSLLSNDCGGSVSGVGGTTIGLSGGTLAPEASCTISVSLSVPAGATPGAYTNTTGAVTGAVDGSPVVGNMASETLFVEPVPILTKEFLEVGTLAPNPVINAGDDVVIRFTITNPSTTSGATDIAFIDELTDGGPGTGFLPFPVTVTLPPTPDPPCGAGSSLALVSVDTDRQGLSLTSGSLAAAPGPGDSCSFDVTVTVPTGFPPGIYLNTTEEVFATIDGATRMGSPANDTLTVIAAPSLTKEFTDDPVAPSGTVTLEFILTYPPDASGDATGITFTDNLAPVLAGLTATGLPLTEACDPDGPGGNPGTGTLSGSAGDTLLTFMGGTLSPGESCTISVSLSVPAGAAPGDYTNTTSGVSATVMGLPATAAPASDDLKVAGLTFTKEFIGDPVIAGDTVTLRFTIDNIHPTDDATITFFTDSLSTALSGLAATGPPSVNTCGGALSGTTFLTYVGGSVLSGQMCTIEVEVLVPSGAADGSYLNLTSSLSATQGGPVTIDPATDNLIVNSTLLQLTKSFTDDPVAPGDPVTLEFNLTNLDASRAASAIDFTDNLGAALAGLTFDSVLFDDCGGTVSGTGTDTVAVSGAGLGAGGTCTIRISVSVPAAAAANIYTNTSSGVTGTIGGFPVTGAAASDDLEVIQLLQFSKSFDGPTTAAGNAKLTFTITNPGSNTAAGLAFSDDLNDVIPGLIAISLPALPCGPSSSMSGISFLTFTGGELPPLGGTCSFDVDVLVPAIAAAGTYSNTTSDLSQSGLKVSDPATATLVIDPPPTFSKAFAPNPMAFGLTSTLVFTIDNSASVLAASSLDFTDNLPAGSMVATPSNASTTCTAGTISAAPGAGVITYSGGTVGAGAVCTVSVDVTTTLLGSFLNVSGSLTSSSGSSGVATDTLNVVAPDLGITKSVTPTLVEVGQTLTYTLAFSNTGNGTATGVVISDTVPLSLTNINVVSSGVTITQTAAAPTYVWLVQDLAPNEGGTITISGIVSSSVAAGNYPNTAIITGTKTEFNATNNVATATLTLLSYDLAIAKSGIRNPGATTVINYTVTVVNNSGTSAPGAIIADAIPAGISDFTWNCVASGGVTCPRAAASNTALDETTGVFPVGGQLMYNITATLAISTATITNTATVTSLTGLSDSDPSNDSATHVSQPASDLYLPLVLKDTIFLPDLVITSLTATTSDVTVVIQNQGNVAAIDAFWVDVYYTNSAPVLNQPGNLFWGLSVPNGGVPIAAGGVVTLTLSSPYYSGGSPPSSANTTVYGQVDSIGLFSYGAVQESNESNNVFGPTISTTALGGASAPQQSQFDLSGLPPRP